MEILTKTQEGKKIDPWHMLLLLMFLGGPMLSCDEENDGMTNIEEVASAELLQVIAETDSTYLIYPELRGKVNITQSDSAITLEIQLEGFPPNSLHAVHLHGGTCEQPQGHWNAGSEESYCNEKSLGITWAKPYAGDVGNVSVGYDGTGSFSITTDLWSVGTGTATDILGLQVIVHETYSDFIGECDPSHIGNHTHFNEKIACGTIL